MRTFLRIMLAFLALGATVALATGLLDLEFGRSNYWDHHGIAFLFFITVFPRLTLLFSSVATGGLLWWLGWLFAPHLLVAVLATLAYWHQNPFLVAAAWLVALGGESSEKYAVVRRSKSRPNQRRGYDSAKWVDAEVRDPKDR